MERLKCVIRPKRSGEESMLLLFAEESLRPLAEAAGHPERYHSEDLLALLKRAEVYVADADGEIAGYVVVETEPADERLAVRCLCLNPAHETQAVAHQLLDWIEGLAFSRRLPRLTASIAATDQPSRKLYERHGFVRAKVGESPDTVLVEKTLFI